MDPETVKCPICGTETEPISTGSRHSGGAIRSLHADAICPNRFCPMELFRLAWAPGKKPQKACLWCDETQGLISFGPVPCPDCAGTGKNQGGLENGKPCYTCGGELSIGAPVCPDCQGAGCGLCGAPYRPTVWACPDCMLKKGIKGGY